MNNIEEAALKADLGRLKGAHNNLVNKTQGDIGMLITAVKQLAEGLTQMEQRIAAIEQRLSGVVVRPTAVPQAQRVAPQAAPQASAPEMEAEPMPAPSGRGPFSWPEDGEEDGELVE